MKDWIDSFYYFIIGAALLLSVLGVWFAAIIPGIDRFGKRFFLSFFTVLMLSCVTVLLEMMLHNYSVPEAVKYIILILETLLLSVPLPMQTIYLLHCCGENIRLSKLLHVVLALWFVFFILLVCTPFIAGFFQVAPETQFSRGPIFPLLPAPMIIVILLNFIHTIRRWRRLSRKAFISFIIAQAPMIVTLTLNIFFDAVPLFDISYVLSALAMYSFILSDQIEQDRRRQREIAIQQQEIAHERSSIMMLQMRPHFIYNTLMSIHSLCWLDPKKAQQVTMDFTNYLRKNFNAIASKKTIPFSEELEHTRAYLAVEQAQYDDMLVVDYDIPFTHFLLPPLTLQPIVENAVKHGIDPDSDPLHICIITRHSASLTRIIVKDNGPGFHNTNENNTYTTLTNIRQRLEMLCGGRLSIKSGGNSGTVVTMTIPDNTENYASGTHLTVHN